MKQHLSPEQISMYCDSLQIEIASLFGEYGNCCRTGGEEINYAKLSDKITIGRMLDILREKYQMIIYTVDELWCVQLLDLNDCGNDVDVACIWEDGLKELCDVLWKAICYNIL
jgi:hypothetical protein